MNFQRLLAQEEQRTSQLDTRLQEATLEVSSLGEKNRELTVQVDTLRQQIEQQQTSASSDTFPDVSSSPDDSLDMPFSDSSMAEFGLSDFSFDESDFNDTSQDAGMKQTNVGSLETPTVDSMGTPTVDSMGTPTVGSMGTPTYYTVIKGDTLYRISRTYGVTVDQLKQWNNLHDHIISIGQRLIVSEP